MKIHLTDYKTYPHSFCGAVYAAESDQLVFMENTDWTHPEIEPKLCEDCRNHPSFGIRLLQRISEKPEQ